MTDALSTALSGAPLTPSPRAPNTPTPDIEAARRVAAEFESVFLNEMLGPMFEGLDTDGLGGGGDGEKAFRPMLIEQYANAIGKSGGIGLADTIVRELMRMQAAQQAALQPAPEADDGPAG